MEIGQSDYRAEANAERGHPGEFKGTAHDDPRLPSILPEESYRDIKQQEQGAKIQMEWSYHSDQRDRQGKDEPSAALHGHLRPEQYRGETNNVVGEGIPAAANAHISRERKQKRTQERSGRTKAAKLEKAKEE